MEPGTTALYQRASEQVRQRERSAQAEPAYQLAARKTATALGVRLSEEQQETGGRVLHWGLDWGVLAVLLRRATGLSPVTTGLLSGPAMFVLVDEGANTLFGFAAPPRAYPLATHRRGLIGHLVHGLGSAIAAEAIDALGRAGTRR